VVCSVLSGAAIYVLRGRWVDGKADADSAQAMRQRVSARFGVRDLSRHMPLNQVTVA